MPELRKDPTVGRWVIIATERVRRPGDFSRPRPPRRGGPCAFCAGHEHETPPEILAYRDVAGGGAGAPDWRVRVVPSKFPALRADATLERRGQDMYDVVSGAGVHEVIVESPDHDRALATLPVEAVAEVLRAYRERVLELKRDERFRAILVFKNHGVEADANLEHPLSQLIAAPTIPFALAAELAHTRTYFDYRERCLFCDMLRQEVEVRARLVVESANVVAFAPFASRMPFETWILPRRHAAAFEHAEAGELHETASVLRTVLRKLDGAIGDPPYSLLLHSAPFGSSESPSYHWHIEITPALGGVASLAGASGFHTNPMPPEDAARFLRETPA